MLQRSPMTEAVPQRYYGGRYDAGNFTGFQKIFQGIVLCNIIQISHRRPEGVIFRIAHECDDAMAHSHGVCKWWLWVVAISV